MTGSRTGAEDFFKLDLGFTSTSSGSESCRVSSWCVSESESMLDSSKIPVCVYDTKTGVGTECFSLVKSSKYEELRVTKIAHF